MKKLIMILSALLCLTMLFASCDSEPTDELAEETTTQAEETTAPAPTETPIETTPEPIPEELKIDYDAIFAQWREYISFESETEDEAETYTTLLDVMDYTAHRNENADYTESLNVTTEGKLVLFTYRSVNSETRYNLEQDSKEDIITYTYRYNVFNLETGKEVYSTQYSYRHYPDRFGAGLYSYDDSHSTPSLTNAFYGFVRVETTAYEYVAAVENDFGYVEIPARWESKTTYSYYDQNGNLLVEGQESPDFWFVSSGNSYQSIVRIGDKYFHTKDGEVIAALGNELKVRLDFGAEEYNGFQYRWSDDTVTVLDTATNCITVNWRFADYFDQRSGYLTTYTLGNGNILFQKKCNTWSDQGIRFGYEYYAPIYTLVDVKTGKVSHITPTCEIDGVTYEYAIVSLISNANDQNTGLSLKDGNHQLAEIVLISDGAAAAKTTLVILDSELQVVATLDRFLQDQAGIDGVLENGDLLIYTESGLYYTVDVNGTGGKKVQLFVSPNNVRTLISGGFVATNGILYNESLEPLVNLYQEYLNGYSITKDGLKAWSEEDRCYHYLSIDSAGQLEIKYAPEEGTYLSSFSFGDCTVYKKVNSYSWSGSDVPYVFTVYNAQGQEIETLYGETCTVTNGMLKLTSGSTSTYYILK